MKLSGRRSLRYAGCLCKCNITIRYYVASFRAYYCRRKSKCVDFLCGMEMLWRQLTKRGWKKILRVGGQHQVEAACSAALTFCFSKTSNMSYLQKWIVLVKQNTSGITNVDSYSHVFLYYQGKFKIWWNYVLLPLHTVAKLRIVSNSKKIQTFDLWKTVLIFWFVLIESSKNQ